MKLAFVYVKGRLARLRDVERFKCAREFFYGALELKDKGHEVSLFEVYDKPTAIHGPWIIQSLYRLHLTPSKTNAFLYQQLSDIAGVLNRFDVIVATTSGIAYALALLKTLRRLQPQIIAIHCGIANYPLKLRRRILNGFMLRKVWTQLFGKGELIPAKQMFMIPDNKIEVNQFGVDTVFWHPAKVDTQDFILSVGNDSRRDYELLIDIAEELDYQFVLITKQHLEKLPPNVRVLKGDWHAETISDEQLRHLYQTSKIVVVPLQETIQPSGQSVCLQAMACGKPVVLTKTKGLWSKTMMRNKDNIIMVKPNDTGELRNAMMRLINSNEECDRIGRKARETVCKEADITLFASRIERLCRKVLSTPSQCST